MVEKLSKEIQYRNISLLVRPARVAILVDMEDKYWKHTLLRIFEWCSRVWGGAYFLIVPTDGKEISDLFWQILEQYSPDLVYAYYPTVEDLETADPVTYTRITNDYREAAKKQIPNIEEKALQDFIDREVKPKGVGRFAIEKSLQEKVKQKLVPFYFQDHVVRERVSARNHVPFPLTDLEKIAVDGHLEKVCLVDRISDIDCSLVFYSNWGRYDEKYVEVLSQKGIMIDRVPDNFRLADLLEVGIKNRIDQSDISLRSYFKGGSNNGWFPSEDITAYSPYRASLLKLERYRNNDPFIDEEPAILVIGDNISDFCLYYCLSRFQDRVFWIPEPTIHGDKKKLSSYDDKDVLIKTVISVINLNDNFFENAGKKIQITSLSQTVEQLEEIKKTIPNYVHIYIDGTDELLKSIEINPKINISEKYIYRYVEQNNYTSSYTEVFESNRSIGNIQTPKPKNFGQINPADHRWITELNIDGYIPPPLHFLGPEIIDLRGLTTETRVSKTGICYTCPNIGYVGGDIDVTLVRPRLKIVETIDIFREYFKEAGFADIRVSDKGNYSEETINKFGSLDEVGDFLKTENNRQLLELFLTQKSVKSNTKGEVVFVRPRTYSDLQSIQSLVGSPEATTTLIDSFIRRGIFYRGLILKCSHCRQPDWFGLGEIDQYFTCKRCGNKEYIQLKNWRDDAEPKWFYKLDEVVYQGVSNNMDVPLLTLAYLKRKSKKSFLYLPEIELRRNPKDKNPDCEIDICCIQDGRILLGECKKPPISKKAIDKLNLFSGKLLRLPDNLVFASFSIETIPEMQAYAEKLKIQECTFLNKSELVGP